MKTTVNLKNRFMVAMGLFLTVLFASCDKELDVQTDFPFEVSVMPVPREIANGQTVEIRFTIEKLGHYAGTDYFIRYFQFEGLGELRLYNEPPFQPNDMYLLPEEQFRLYYTSRSHVTEEFDVWIVDSFGNEKRLNFRFGNDNTRRE